MRRTLVAVLAILITFCQPMPADAMWWAWLEKWSGPGPFKAKPFRTFLFTACAQEVRTPPAPFPQTAKRLALRPSPIARTDAFHQQQEAIARLMAANNPDKADPATKDDFYARLLANPVTPTTRLLAADIVARKEKPQQDPTALERSANAPIAQQVPQDLALLSRAEAAFLAGNYDQRANVGPGHEHRRMLCGYFDVGLFESDGDQDPGRGFPALNARVYDFGPSVRIRDGIDVGFGAGWVQFTGEGVDRRQSVITPLRVIVRPALVLVPETKRQEWMGVLSLYWKQIYVWGRMTGADFGAPQSEWVEDGEMIRSFGLNLDLTALLPLVLQRN